MHGQKNIKSVLMFIRSQCVGDAVTTFSTVNLKRINMNESVKEEQKV